MNFYTQGFLQYMLKMNRIIDTPIRQEHVRHMNINWSLCKKSTEKVNLDKTPIRSRAFIDDYLQSLQHCLFTHSKESGQFVCTEYMSGTIQDFLSILQTNNSVLPSTRERLPTPQDQY